MEFALVDATAYACKLIITVSADVLSKISDLIVDLDGCARASTLLIFGFGQVSKEENDEQRV